MVTTFSCFGFAFGVQASDPVLDDLVRELYAPFATSDDPQVVFGVVEWRDGGEPPVFAVYCDAERTRVTADPHVALAHLVWEISREVVARSSGAALLLHAAAAEDDGRAVLLPAPSGSGKSTLVAGLVASGLGYLTDDVSVVDLESGAVAPYPKPIAVDRALWPLLSTSGSQRAGAARYNGPEGYLASGHLHGAPGRPSQPVAVVSPRYRPGAATLLRPMTQREAIALLAEQSFNVNMGDARTLHTLGDMVRSCSLHQLEYHDLQEAVTMIKQLLAAG